MGHTYRAVGLEPIGTWVIRLDQPVYVRPAGYSSTVDPGTPEPFA